MKSAEDFYHLKRKRACIEAKGVDAKLFQTAYCDFPTITVTQIYSLSEISPMFFIPFPVSISVGFPFRMCLSSLSSARAFRAYAAAFQSGFPVLANK